jgi:pSer/pThr/pTyr-binding forkhead associated (FHA) protein
MAAAELLFDWGAEPIETDLRIGRDPDFSPLACHLKRFDTVSRKHAELRLQNGILRITHVGSTNPTYLNGQPLKRGASTILGDGDVLRFSSQVRAVVHFASVNVLNYAEARRG